MPVFIRCSHCLLLAFPLALLAADVNRHSMAFKTAENP